MDGCFFDAPFDIEAFINQKKTSIGRERTNDSPIVNTDMRPLAP